MSRIYKQSTISPAIPGYTAGAGKCLRCDLPAEWMQSWIEYRHGKQIGISRRFYCTAHKPAGRVTCPKS